MFALGTFINSCEERTEHANSLDHSIALNLMNTVSEDGSSLVRQELVVALQYIVLAFESNFVNVRRQAMEEEERHRMQELLHNYPQLSNQPPTAGSQYHTITSSTSSAQNQQYLHTQGYNAKLGYTMSNKNLQPSISSSALDQLGHANRSAGNLGSVSSMSSLSHGNIYSKLWNGIILLASDPDPDVSSMTNVIIAYIRSKTREGHSISGVSVSIGSNLTIVGRDSAGRGTLETSSVPSSPSKPSLILQSPSNQQSGMKSLPPQPLTQSNVTGVETSQKNAASTSRAFTVHPITEEEVLNRKHSSNELQQPSSPNHKMPQSGRGGSVGRHPSGGHHSTAPILSSSGSNSNVVNVASTPILRAHNLNRSISNVEQPKLTTNFMPWSAKYFTKVWKIYKFFKVFEKGSHNQSQEHCQ